MAPAVTPTTPIETHAKARRRKVRMDTLNELVTWLSAQSDLIWDIRGGYIQIEQPSPKGFSVWISDDGEEWTVGFDGFHHHCRTELEAIGLFLEGLSGDIRLAITYRDDSACRWTTQRKVNDQWRPFSDLVSHMRMLLFHFWRPKRIEYLQNTQRNVPKQ